MSDGESSSDLTDANATSSGEKATLNVEETNLQNPKESQVKGTGAKKDVGEKSDDDDESGSDEVIPENASIDANDDVYIPNPTVVQPVQQTLSMTAVESPVNSTSPTSTVTKRKNQHQPNVTISKKTKQQEADGERPSAPSSKTTKPDNVKQQQYSTRFIILGLLLIIAVGVVVFVLIAPNKAINLVMPSVGRRGDDPIRDKNRRARTRDENTYGRDGSYTPGGREVTRRLVVDRYEVADYVDDDDEENADVNDLSDEGYDNDDDDYDDLDTKHPSWKTVHHNQDQQALRPAQYQKAGLDYENDRSDRDDVDFSRLTSSVMRLYYNSFDAEEDEILRPRDDDALGVIYPIANTAANDEGQCKTQTCVHKRFDLIAFKDKSMAILDGYAIARLACIEVSKNVGWHVSRARSVASSKQRKNKSPPMASLERFKNPLYLSSASVYSPYYCINLPLSETLVNRWSASGTSASLASDGGYHRRQAAKNSRKERERARQRQIKQDAVGLTAFYTAWRDLAKGNSATSYVTSASESFATSVIHNSLIMGYLRNHVVTRDLLKLGTKEASESRVSMISYTAIMDSLRSIVDGHEQFMQLFNLPTRHSVCMCGPHINMGHHVVGYADARHKRAVVYFEPIITSSPPTADDVNAVSYDMEVTLFPWIFVVFDRMDMNKSSPTYKSDEMLTGLAEALSGTTVTEELMAYVSYAISDTLFRFNVMTPAMPTFLASTKITVEYMRIDKSTSSYTSRHNTRYESADGDDDENESFETFLHSDHVHDGKRTVTEVEGQEAICIQYCQQLAYSMVVYADKSYEQGAIKPENTSPTPTPKPKDHPQERESMRDANRQQQQRNKKPTSPKNKM